MSIDTKALRDTEASLFLKIARFMTEIPTDKCLETSQGLSWRNYLDYTR